MKTKILISAILFVFITLNGFSQSIDSIRTKNDKPGTPQALRTPDNSPRNRVHTIKRQKHLNQTINHGATESNKVIDKKQPEVIVPNSVNKTTETKSPVTLAPQNNPPAITDSTGSNKSLSNGQDNVTNPIRK